MTNELKNFASGKDWWYMNREKGVHLIEIISELYHSRLRSIGVELNDDSAEVVYDEIESALDNLTYELQSNPEILYEKVGIKLDKSNHVTQHDPEDPETY